MATRRSRGRSRRLRQTGSRGMSWLRLIGGDGASWMWCRTWSRRRVRCSTASLGAGGGGREPAALLIGLRGFPHRGEGCGFACEYRVKLFEAPCGQNDFALSQVEDADSYFGVAPLKPEPK